MNPWVLKKSPQAKCFCSAQCCQCPGLRKCEVYSGSDSRHRAFAVKLVRELLWSLKIHDAQFNGHYRTNINMRSARRWLKVMEGKR